MRSFVVSMAAVLAFAGASFAQTQTPDVLRGSSSDPKKVQAKPEFLGHLLLPLFDETTWRDNQAAFQVAPDQKLLD